MSEDEKHMLILCRNLAQYNSLSEAGKIIFEALKKKETRK